MTDAIWYIIHIIVAAVAFAVGFRIAAEIREWRDNTRNIEREIPFSLFLEAYGKAQDWWSLLPYYVRYGADDVRFENYADYRKYKKWREKRKRDEEADRKRSMNERLFRDIQSDLMPTPPTTGSGKIEPKANKDKPTNAELDKIRADLMLTAQAQEKQNNPRCKDCKHMRYRHIDNGKIDTICVKHRTSIGFEPIFPEMVACGIFEPKTKTPPPPWKRPEPLGTVTTH